MKLNLRALVDEALGAGTYSRLSNQLRVHDKCLKLTKIDDTCANPRASSRSSRLLIPMIGEDAFMTLRAAARDTGRYVYACAAPAFSQVFIDRVARNDQILTLRGRGLSYGQITRMLRIKYQTVAKVCQRHQHRASPQNSEHPCQE